MTIGKRIALGYVIVLTLSTLVCGGGLYAISYSRAAYNEFVQHDIAVVVGLYSVRLSIEEQNSSFRGYMLYRDPDMLARWNAASEDFDKVQSRLKTQITDPADLATLGEIETARRNWRSVQAKRIEYTGVTGDTTLDELDEQRTNLRELILERVEGLVKRRNDAVEETRANLESRIAQIATAMIALAVLALAAGIGTAVWATTTISRTLQDAIGRLASSTAEISAMTRQVAAGAAETAASVRQTSSTVEEIRQTATLSAQKAKAVSQSAQRSLEISDSGRRSVEDSLHGMQAIRRQMDTIAQSVIHLSEQGQAIGEIIATVNDLADQTNLLSVNASIEAARAGEHGKGFGVVAQEVRSLADQSKSATAQVRTILGEVQRATGSAVMAAEQGHKAVAAGETQTGAVDTVIQQLAAQIAEAAQSATQIAASSQQQLAGMEQVALAMENINQASKQNATGTGQAESAAEDLKRLAGQLRAIIERRKSAAPD